MKEYLLTVTALKEEAKNVKTVRFDLNGEKINFIPGQFIIMFLEGAKKPAASYSISCPPNDKYIEITAKLYGDFSHKLFNLKVGDKIKIRGPFGNFCFDGQFKNDVVMIAGGIGICPFKSMIYNAINKGIKNNITLLYSCRTLDDIAYYNELKNIKSKNIKVVFTLTREKRDGNYEHGRVDINMIKKYVKDINDSVFYVCGLKKMIDDTTNMLKDLGVRKENIKTELWG